MDIEKFKQYGGATQRFSLNDLKTYARVVNIYDGDTIQAIIPVFDTYFKFSIRLHGIDTSEMTSKITEQKVLAIKARNRIVELTTGRPSDINVLKTKKSIETFLDNEVFLVWLHCFGMDKYGRVLANIYSSESDKERSFADILIAENLGTPYFGKTKLCTL